MISNIKYTRKEFIKIKGQYKLKTYSQQKINYETYKNIVSKETMSFFRNLGGEEEVIKRRTKFGNKIIESKSKSPNKEIIIIRYFNFDEALEV